MSSLYEFPGGGGLMRDPTDREIDDLVRSYPDRKLAELRGSAPQGTEWRRILDAERRRRGLAEDRPFRFAQGRLSVPDDDFRAKHDPDIKGDER